ncbi:MAG: hypothetical protein HYV08_02925 [Deltaproteobacteria bacterium]|nr:hypothetical protein [Deltaproteobacteria bacterium]
MKILHVIRRPDDELPLSVARSQQDFHKVAVLLVQDGVLSHEDPGCPVYLCAEDAEARGVGSGPPRVSYPEIVDLLFEHDKVICW